MMFFISRFRRPIRFLAALTVALLLALSSTVLAFAQGVLQISSDPFTDPTSNHETEVEPSSFAFGNTIVVALQQGRFFDGGGSDIGFATSQDGGHTWVQGSLPGVTVNSTPPGPYARASDASVAFDAKHNVWIISYLGIRSPASAGVDVDVSRSTDGGLTWSSPVVVNASGDVNAKNWTTCDDTPTSPFFANCYTEFDDISKLNLFQVSTSTDGGLTWGAAKTDPNSTCVIGGQPVVQPNGTVIVPIDDCQETQILSITSTDGGNTWSNPVVAAQVLNDGHPGNIRSPDLPSAEIDSSGRVYVVWTDCRTEKFCDSGNNDLLLITSNDGTAWSAPVRIPTSSIGCTTASCADILIPGLAVDRNTSGSSARLAVVYYTFPSIDCTATGTSVCHLNVGFLSSTNGGASWSAPVDLAGPMTLTWMPLTTQGFMVADYLSASIASGADHANPVFEVAKAPTKGTTCSNIQTGAPGSNCEQDTFTALEALGGGTNAATSVPFIVPAFAGTPETSNCHSQSVSALAQQFGGLNAAAAALGYPNAQALQSTITAFCKPLKAETSTE